MEGKDLGGIVQCSALVVRRCLAHVRRPWWRDYPRWAGRHQCLAQFFEKERPTPQRLFYCEFHERGFQQAVRWQHWKAIRGGKGKPLRLYNLDVDIGEGKDLALDYPAVIAKMEGIL